MIQYSRLCLPLFVIQSFFFARTAPTGLERSKQILFCLSKVEEARKRLKGSDAKENENDEGNENLHDKDEDETLIDSTIETGDNAYANAKSEVRSSVSTRYYVESGGSHASAVNNKQVQRTEYRNHRRMIQCLRRISVRWGCRI
jgi:hypothetical protein